MGRDGAREVEIAEQDMLFKLSTDLHMTRGHARSGGDAKFTQTYKVPDGSAEFRQQGFIQTLFEPINGMIQSEGHCSLFIDFQYSPMDTVMNNHRLSMVAYPGSNGDNPKRA